MQHKTWNPARFVCQRRGLILSYRGSTILFVGCPFTVLGSCQRHDTSQIHLRRRERRKEVLRTCTCVCSSLVILLWTNIFDDLKEIIIGADLVSDFIYYIFPPAREAYNLHFFCGRNHITCLSNAPYWMRKERKKLFPGRAPRNK